MSEGDSVSNPLVEYVPFGGRLDGGFNEVPYSWESQGIFAGTGVDLSVEEILNMDRRGWYDLDQALEQDTD